MENTKRTKVMHALIITLAIMMLINFMANLGRGYTAIGGEVFLAPIVYLIIKKLI